MSNTVITSYADVGGGISKSGKQLVLLVNPDGSLTLEKNVLQSLLDEKNPEDLSVSLVHVNDDGKPKKLKEENDSDDDSNVPYVNLTVNAFYDANKANEELIQRDAQNEISEAAQNLFRLSFQNDHCYTPHRLPDEEENIPSQRNEVLNVSDTKSKIPSSKKITILENKIIPKGKKLFNLTTDGQIILNRSEILKKIAEAQRTNTTSIISSTKSSVITGILDKNQSTDKEPVKITTSNITNLKETIIENKKLNSSFQNEYIKNITKDFKSDVINKNVKNLLTKKIESKRESPITNIQDSSEQIKPNKLMTSRNYGRDSNRTMLLTDRKTKRTAGNEVKEIDTNEMNKDKGNKLPSKKRPPAHMTVLLNDMTSLFSTPDVLRRVSSDGKSPKILDPIGVKKEEMESGESLFKNDVRTYNRSNASNKSNQQNIYKKELKSEPEQNLVQIFTEPGEYSGMNDLPPLQTGDNTLQTGSSSMLMSPSSNLNAPLSPSLDILGGIQAEEEGLSEDLLMHVAQLVESSEKLQEVIDNQVLGKIDDTQSKEIIYPIQTPLLQMDQLAQQDKRPTTPITRKEPIQIVRSNGRVITLPPIEAPATRASKRRSLLNTPLEQAAAVVKAPAPTPTPDVSLSPNPTQPKTNTNVNKKSAKSEKHQSLPLPTEVDVEENAESDESWNSEDDPDRLWCICKQPHNNRFMICCDMCEDWFHGKCVNITKAMGQEMEEKGVEWRCPTCVKKKNLGKFPFKPSSPRKSLDSKNEINLESDAYSHLAVTPGKSAPAQSSNTNCIVCKKPARVSSIYCSDACILKHAQESLTMTSPSAAKPNMSSKDDIRVIVYERKTGKCLAGPNAPTAANLKNWLKENPTFEVVRPGTIPSNKQPTHAIRQKSVQKIQSVLKIGEDKQIMLSQPHKGQSQNPPNSPATKSPQSVNKQTPNTSMLKSATLKIKESPKLQSPTEHSPKLQLKMPTQKQTTKTYSKTPTTPKTPTQKQPPLKSPTTLVQSKKDDSRSKSNSTDLIRENVKKTLQELLTARMAETKNVQFTPEEISKFAIDTEYELHDLFKDVGVKYKAKYRSLTFNLKDRKNLSLWQKICDRSITPKQLVRLSPEELASQELAQWRDQEAKHQLELIKKSELDLLACNKTYVLKTHKGEEVIENKSLPTTELDPNVTLDDIVSALNHSTEEESKEQKNDEESGNRSASASPTRSHKHSHSSHHKHKNRSRSRSKSSRNRKDHSSDRRKSSSKHRSSRDSKSSSGRSHRKKSSRERNKSQDKHVESLKKSSSLHKESHHSGYNSSSRSKEKNEPDRDEKLKRSRSREHSKHRSHSRDKRLAKDYDRSSIETKDKSSPKESEKSHKRHEGHEKRDRHDGHYERHHSHHDRQDSRRERHDSHHERHDSHHERRSRSQDKLEIDEKLILKATEDADILLPPVENIDIASPPSPGAPQIATESVLNLIGSESDQEPSSTVDSPSILWNGCISMVDVAKFNVSMFEVSGACHLLPKDLRTELEIVGRIQPETVWDYVDKMKKQANKEIILTKILPADENEQAQYSVFYNYLNSRNRLGVVKSHGGCIKDFYIVPLPSHTALPSILLPLTGPGLGEFKPNLLVGVIVGQKRKRASTTASAIPAKINKLKEKEERSYTPPVGSYTPPQSPKQTLPSYPLLPSLSSTVKHQIAASLASADDEPYSPVDSDSLSRSPTDLHKKMEELDRKIEERKKQIQSMAGNITSTRVLDEPYSPSRPMSPESSKKPAIPGLADISLPSNLQEILATIHQKTANTTETVKPIQETTYIPTAINIDVASAGASIYYKEGLTGDVDMRVIGTSFNTMSASNVFHTSEKSSKLSSLSEAELLSMVPDNEVFPPLPPLPVQNMSVPPPPYKRIRVSMEPPPPGLEDVEE